MEYRKICLFVTFLSAIEPCMVSASEEEPWVAFRVETETADLCGYKDKAGTVRIPLRFTAFTCAGIFRNIVAVDEYVKGRSRSYFLLKSGKKIGMGNVYTHDFTNDCESEYSIRFRDNKRDRVGYLRGNGTVLIPAIYNEGTPFRNGVAQVIKGAKKVCPSGEVFGECEHWGWEGGTGLLIDKTNRVLVRNFIGDFNWDWLEKQEVRGKPNFAELLEGELAANKKQASSKGRKFELKYKARHHLDWDSLEVSQTPPGDKNRVVYKGTDGRYYSFIDFEKEFHNWLTENLLQDLTRDKLSRNAYKSISYQDDQNGGWIHKESRGFIETNYELLRKNLLAAGEGANHSFTVDTFDPWMLPAGDFEQYVVECESAQGWKSPVMDLSIDEPHDDNELAHQNHFEFLRTSDGYKLFRVRMVTGSLR